MTYENIETLRSTLICLRDMKKARKRQKKSGFCTTLVKSIQLFVDDVQILLANPHRFRGYRVPHKRVLDACFSELEPYNVSKEEIVEATRVNTRCKLGVRRFKRLCAEGNGRNVEPFNVSVHSILVRVRATQLNAEQHQRMSNGNEFASSVNLLPLKEATDESDQFAAAAHCFEDDDIQMAALTSDDADNLSPELSQSPPVPEPLGAPNLPLNCDDKKWIFEDFQKALDGCVDRLDGLQLSGDIENPGDHWTADDSTDLFNEKGGESNKITAAYGCTENRRLLFDDPADGRCLCKGKYSVMMHAVPRCTEQRTEVCRQHGGRFHNGLFFALSGDGAERNVAVCVFCARDEARPRDGDFCADRAVAKYRDPSGRNVLTFLDPVSNAWCDDSLDERVKNSAGDKLNDLFGGFEPCRSPRIELVNIKVITLTDGRPIYTAIFKIGCLNVGAALMLNFVTTREGKRLLRFFGGEWAYTDEYNVDGKAGGCYNMEHLPNANKHTLWRGHVIDYHNTGDFVKTDCGIGGKTLGSEQWECLVNCRARKAIADVFGVVPEKSQQMQAQQYDAPRLTKKEKAMIKGGAELSATPNDRLPAHRDHGNRGFEGLTLDNPSPLSFVSRCGEIEYLKLTKPVNSLLYVAPKSFLGTQYKHYMGRSMTQSTTLLARRGEPKIAAKYEGFVKAAPKLVRDFERRERRVAKLFPKEMKKMFPKKLRQLKKKRKERKWRKQQRVVIRSLKDDARSEKRAQNAHQKSKHVDNDVEMTSNAADRLRMTRVTCKRSEFVN